MEITTTHVCGRFDNAPPHIIIISDSYATAVIGGHNYSEQSDDEYEAKKDARFEAAEKARADRDERNTTLLASRAEARKIREQEEKKLKEARSQENKKLPQQKKALVDGQWLDTRPKRVRNKKVVHKINPLFEREDSKSKVPGGYQLLQGMDGLFSVPYMRRVIKSGEVKAVKMNRSWYVETESVLAFVARAPERKAQAAKIALQKARDARGRGKKQAVTLDQLSMESIQ